MKRIDDREEPNPLKDLSSYSFIGLLLMLILVFVTMGKIYKEETGIEIKRPDGESSSDFEVIYIGISNEGVISVGGKQVQEFNLASIVEERINNLKSSLKLRVVISADEGSKMNDFSDVMSRLNALDNSRIEVFFK